MVGPGVVVVVVVVDPTCSDGIARREWEWVARGQAGQGRPFSFFLFFPFPVFIFFFCFLFPLFFFWSARPSSLVGKVGTSNVMEVMDWGIGPLCLDARTRGAADTGRAAAAGAGNGSCRLPLPVQRSLCSRGSSAKMWRLWRRLPPDRRWCGPAIRGTQCHSQTCMWMARAPQSSHRHWLSVASIVRARGRFQVVSGVLERTKHCAVP